MPGEKKRQLTLSFKNVILGSETCCLISNTLFVWSSFMVLLQLLGRTVSDCLIRCAVPLGAGDTLATRVIRASLAFLAGKMCLPGEWSSATELKPLKI